MHRKLATAMRGFAATLVVTSITCGAALAQDWPAKTIRAIVPLTAGSATDLIARAVQNPTVRERLAKLGADPMILSAAAFDKLVREKIALNTKIAAAAGVKAN